LCGASSGRRPSRSQAWKYLPREGSGKQSLPQAKLLDFGLAKNTAPVVAVSGSMAPTTPANVTAQGTILGTFRIAPEQIEGLEADARTDIFAFGAVLFEIVTGRKAFGEEPRQPPSAQS
jgi:serine/threonine protein kinase